MRIWMMWMFRYVICDVCPNNEDHLVGPVIHGVSGIIALLQQPALPVLVQIGR